MNRHTLVRVLLVALLALAGFWLASVTEWTEVEIHKPPSGEAARDELFAAQEVMKQLGARVERRKALDAMPPKEARLVLSSQYWDLFPEREALLRKWVEDGGHLVISASMAAEPAFASWLPVEMRKRPRPSSGAKKKPDEEENEDDDEANNCRQLSEARETSASGANVQSYRLCLDVYWKQLRPKAGVAAQWALEGPAGIEMLRMPVGRGSVTVNAPWDLMHNVEVLREDHALIMVSALQLERGTQVWLVAEETREQFLAWIWQKGWPAVLLSLLAATAWLWRSAVRFGPLGSLETPQRRSMKEQVAGTGAFLRQHGAASLHAAQVRALLETARARLPGFASMGHAAATQALAKATSVDAAAISRALKPASITPQSLAADLELLEAVRRRLVQFTPHRSS